jgi:monovalent cation:H+ antiporter-2, CPA2 family
MPHELPLLTDLVIILLASIPIAFLSKRLRLPMLVGFMITGILIGPFGFGLIREVEAVEALAEIGVVLLLFTIGLEFSLSHLREMQRVVLGGGGLQVTLTIAAAAGLFVTFGWELKRAVFFGFLFALSSTAIVLKSYMDRLEIDTPHGRAAIGILLFQDLCIVPMMLLVPLLSGQRGSAPAAIVLTLGKAALVVAGIILTARIVVPFLLYHVVRLRSPEVFIMFVVLVSLGTALVSARFGLSMALGAFIAGLVLAESEYSHQIVSDMLPFRDIFNSVFFVSIGMLLSPAFLLSDLPMVLLWFGALLLGKALIILLIASLLGYGLRVALMIGLGLAQVGEFSFILAETGQAQGLITPGDFQRFLAAAILSMLATPFVIRAGPRLGFAAQALFARGTEPEEQAAPLQTLRNHVIIVGYGMNGRNLSHVLQRVGVPYVVLELNAEVVRAERANGVPIHYGDASRKEVLHQARIEHARMLVLAISDPVAARHATALARELNPALQIIVRTRYMSEVGELLRLGAQWVIPEEFETSIEIFSRVLREFGMSREQIQQAADEVRSEGYELLRARYEVPAEVK